MRTYTYETPGPLRLRLEIPVGQIEVETVSGTTTHVELEAASDDMREVVENARIDLRERGEGHEVIVEVQSRFGIFISFGRGQDVRLRITCPPGADLEIVTKSADLKGRGEFGEVAVKTASGDVTVEDADGDVRVKTASGDVHLDRTGGTTSVQTASGDVSITRADGEVSVQLVSGDLWIRDANSSVSARTVSGDQKIEAVMRGSVELNTVSGDVLVGVRRGSEVYVDANTVSGSTRSELELSDAPAEETTDDAPQLDLRAKTISGDISVVRAPAPTQLPAA